MKKIINQFDALRDSLKKDKQVVVNNFVFFNSPANLNELKELEASGKMQQPVVDFYRVSDGFEIDWTPAESTLADHDLVGRVKVNPIQKVLISWKGIVFFDDEPENSPKRKFFPLDFFADEASVGFCTYEGYRSMMFFYQFEGDMIPLYVDFEGYLKLMLLTRGCYYWQYLIREITEGEENTVSARIKKYLPQVFPDFSFEKFKKLFNKLRVD